MKRWIFLFIVFTALLLSIHIARVQAANPAPMPITPQQGEIIQTVRLEWLVPDYTLKNTSPYRVQIANNPTFQPTEKDYYTQNTYYSPTSFEEGVWYWRILSKDINGVDSDWSQSIQFTYSTVLLSSPAPTPQIAPSISPSPSVIHSPTPIPSASPLASPTPTATPSPYFTISNLPSTINSTDSFQLTLNLYLPQSPQTIFYLKGAFYEEGSSNYFGQTKYSENWIKNSQTYSSQYKIQTDSQGKWQGKIEFIPDPQDSGFSSSGEYHFKVGRYTAAGSGPTWSDNQTVFINEVIIPSPSPSPSLLISPSPSPYAALKTDANKSISLIEDQPRYEESTESAIEASQSAFNQPELPTVAGIATVAGDLATKKNIPTDTQVNPGWFYLSAGILFLVGIASAFIVKYQLGYKIKKWLFPPTQLMTPKNSPPLWQRDLPPEAEWWR